MIWTSALLALSGCQSAGLADGMDQHARSAPRFGRDVETRLYVLAGQSNMAGRGKIESQDAVAHPRVFMLTKEGRWAPATEPLHFDKPDVDGVGPGLAFGKAMAAQYPHAIIGLIPTAVGGSVIASWRPGGYHAQTGVYPYDDSIKRAREAVAGGGKIVGILWHQGEFDSRRDKASLYAGELQRLVASYRHDLQLPHLPFVVGGLGDYLLARNSDAHTVQKALSSAPQNIPCSAFASAEGLHDKGDELHFDSTSARELGRRFAIALQSVAKRPSCSDSN